MELRHVSALFGMLVILAAAGCPETSTKCEEDDDCRFDRICRAGACTTPPSDPSADGGADVEDTEDGIDAAPRIDVPSKLSLETKAAETSKVLEVRNPGAATLRIEGVGIDGADVFSVTRASADAGAGSRPIDEALPIEVGPDGRLRLRVWFRPVRPTTYRATLTIRSNADGGEATVDLVGRAHDDPPPTVCLKPVDSREIHVEGAPGESTQEEISIENCASSGSVTVSGARVGPSPPFRLSKKSNIPVTLAPDDRMTVLLEFTPERAGAFEGQLELKTDVPRNPTVRFPVYGKAASDCAGPNAEIRAKEKGTSNWRTAKFTTAPTTTLVFDGTESTPGSNAEKVAGYRWTFVDRPTDSLARFQPGGGAPSPTVFLDRVGTYTVDLVAVDEEGDTSCEPARLTVEARPSSDIYVSLTWETPNDSTPTDDQGADLDLHYRNKSNGERWNEAPWDIFWNNTTADWGQENVASDNPELLVEDTDGAGPEAVAHDNPVSGKRYAVGVYYYDDHGYGASYATVRIFVDGTLRRAFKDRKLEGTFWFWTVGIVEWSSKNIYERDEISENGFP